MDWLTEWKDNYREVEEPITDIISWQNNDIDRDKSSIDCYYTGSLTLEGMSQLSDSTGAIRCTE
jgi:hypothetical protein